MKFFILFALVATTTALYQKSPVVPVKDAPVNDERIISGQAAALGQFPWQVANKFTVVGGTAFCGGALICDRWVLTAAHCALDASSFTIYMGSLHHDVNKDPNVVVQRSTDGFVHEEYNPWTLNNDIALVKLPEKVEFNDNIQPISLGQHRTADNVTLTVSGWGKVKDGPVGVSQQLNFVDLQSISNEECEDYYGRLTIKSSTICCKGRPEHSTCNGDSGGPLVEKGADGKHHHVGVVSFVSSAGCASGAPSGYVRTANYIDWINKHVGDSCKLA